MPDGLNPQVIPFNAGTYVNLYALGIRYLVRGAQTAGRLSIVEHPLPPRALGSPVHTHSREDEISYVAEGLVGVQLGDQVFTAGPGDTIVKPRGIPHAFWNAGDTPARIAEIITPAGFEDYFEELAPILAEAGHAPPDPERIAPILARYGLSLDFSTVPILMERHGLR